MAVTLYLFDHHKAVRAVVKGYSELIHSEGKWALNAAIPGHYGAVTGEFLGFRCIDGNFRMFQIDETEGEDETGRTIIAGTDAAVAELSDMVAVDVRLDNATAQEAFEELLRDTGWTLGTVTAEQTKTAKISAYYVETWEALQKAAAAYNVRLEAFYTFEDGEITGRTMNAVEKEAVFGGRILTSERNEGGIRIIKTGSPKTAMYGAGAATGTTDNPDRVTIADVVWSKANGDPADKPNGQLWVEDAEAVAEKGRRAGAFVDQSITDANELMKATWEELQKKKEPQAVGRATMQDIEPTEGHEHEKLRMWDLIAVRNQRGETATAQITDIDRDYVTPWLSKITLGEEEDITSQMASVTQSVDQLGRSGAGGRNAAEENKEFIVENMGKIRLHTITILEHGERISEAEITLGEQGIVLSDAVKTLGDTQETLSQAIIRINGVESSIQLHTDRLDNINDILTAAGIYIDGKEPSVTLVASQKSVNELGERVTDAESSIKVNKDSIEAKVSKNDIISSINITPESVVINSAKIDLTGYTTIDELESVRASITNLKTGYTKASLLKTTELIADHASIPSLDVSALYVSETRATWQSATVVTGVSKTSIVDMYGTRHEVVTSISTRTINYLGYTN